MTGRQRRRCPVCWSLVARTMHGMIEGHWDSVGRDTCPAGKGYPYWITLAPKRRAVVIAA